MKTQQIFVTVLVLSVCQWSVIAVEIGELLLFFSSSFYSIFLSHFVVYDFENSVIFAVFFFAAIRLFEYFVCRFVQLHFSVEQFHIFSSFRVIILHAEIVFDSSYESKSIRLCVHSIVTNRRYSCVK